MATRDGDPGPKRRGKGRVRIPHPHLPHLTLKQVRILRLFGLLFVFSLLVIYAVFRSVRFQELLRKRTETLLTERLARSVTIGGFDLYLIPPAFVVRNVTVANDPRGVPGPCFSAAEIELRGIPSLFGRRLVLPRFRVVSPTVDFEIFDDGTNNFSRLLPGAGGASGEGLDVTLREAVVQRATLRFREWKSQLDAILEDAAFTSQGRWFGATSHLDLRARKARLRIGEYDTLEFAIKVAADLSPGRLRFQEIHLRGPQISVDAFGGIDNLHHPSIQLFPTVETRGEELKKLFGIGVPLEGTLRAKGSLLVLEHGGVEGRASFELPDGSFGPFRMKAAGLLHVDQAGVLVQVTRAEYAGGTLDAEVRVERLKNPPLPADLIVHGRGIGFERFLADLGLEGTGMLGRADLDATLTWGHGGIERADGTGSLKVVADPQGAPEIEGRHPLPTSGGGPLLVRDGQILFDRTTFVTRGGLTARMDGSIAIGSWTPDLTFRLEARDLAELERTTENWYAAIQGEPLDPPLRLGGSGRIEARLTRSFGDPRIEGTLEASGLLLRGARFGEASAAFTVDRRVATFAPFAAVDGPASLDVSGEIGWGGPLGPHYRLQDLSTGVRAWPIERVLAFLDVDLPLSGPVSGSLSLSGVTPALTGRAPVVWEKASAWGQRADRVEGMLAFEGDRIRISGADAALAGGAAKGNGFYRWADGGFEASLDVDKIPVGSIAKVAEAAPSLGGLVTARLSGGGTISKPALDLAGSLSEARWGPDVLGEPDRPIAFSAKTGDGAWSATVEIPDVVSFTAETPASPDAVTSIRLAGEHLAPFSSLLGLPVDARFDGRLDLSASFRLPAGGAATGEGVLSALAATLWDRTLSIARPVPFRIEQGRVVVEKADLAETAGPGGKKPLAPSTATLSGSFGLEASHPMELTVTASVNASLLGPLVAPSSLSGRFLIDGKVAGTVARPELAGRATLEGVDFRPAAGSPFEKITGTVSLAGGRVAARDVSLRYSGGAVDLDATAALEGLRLTSLRAAARLATLRIQPMPGFRATVSGDLRLEGDSTLRSARGEIVVDRALYDADVGLSLASILSGRRNVSTVSVPGPFDAVALDVRIVFPPSSIEVRNDVARLKLSGDILLRGNVGRPVLYGQLEAEAGGRLTLRDQKYDLTSGKIIFSNPSRIEPFFDVDAETSIRTSGGDYRVRAVVTGTPERLAARFSSDPQLTEAQIVSLLATGALPPSAIPGAPGVSGSSSDASVAQAARDLLAGLATEALTSRTKEFFRLDRLQIDPNFQGSSFTGPRVTVGKTFGKNFTATIAYQFGSANNAQQQVISLEYEISRTAFLQFMQDEYGVYSVELKFRKQLR